MLGAWILRDVFNSGDEQAGAPQRVDGADDISGDFFRDRWDSRSSPPTACFPVRGSFAFATESSRRSGAICSAPTNPTPTPLV